MDFQLDGFHRLRAVSKDEANCTETFLAIDERRNEEVLIKVVDLDEEYLDLESVSKEILLLRSCRSDNIVNCLGAHISSQPPYKLYIVTEASVASATDLLAACSRDAGFSEATVAFIVHEVLLGLVYLHSEHLIHRDIKGSNIVLNREGGIKLSEFGVASRLKGVSNRKCQTYVGTPLWMAPEVIENGPGRGTKDSGYDEAADIWSLGITAIELATGHVPRMNIPPMRLLFVIVQEPPPELDDDFSPSFRDFVKQCLQKDPSNRPTAIDLLMHPFVSKVSQTQELLDCLQKACPLEGEWFSSSSPNSTAESNPPGDETVLKYKHASDIVSHEKLGSPYTAETKTTTVSLSSWHTLASMLNAISKGKDQDLSNILTNGDGKGRSSTSTSGFGPLGEYLLHRYSSRTG